MVTARERVPVPRMTRAHGEHTRLWIGLSGIIVALLGGGITWVILRPAPTAPALPASVTGFDYVHEATTRVAADPGITAEYFHTDPPDGPAGDDPVPREQRRNVRGRVARRDPNDEGEPPFPGVLPRASPLISRILSRTAIYLGPTLPSASSGLPGT